MDQCKTSKDYVEGTEKYKAYANDVATSSTQTGFQIDAFRSAPPHNDTNLLYIFILKSRAKKLKKGAFKCPWEDCNFLRHDWSNHTVKVYHYLWVIRCAHHCAIRWPFTKANFQSRIPFTFWFDSSRH